jgi:hypothetical protein
MIGTYTLSEDERAEVGAILGRIGQDAENLEEHRFLDRAPLLAHELPVGVRARSSISGCARQRRACSSPAIRSSRTMSGRRPRLTGVQAWIGR